MYQVRRLKIDSKKLSKKKVGTLHKLFAEAKWFYNNFISKENCLEKDTKNSLLRQNFAEVLNTKTSQTEKRPFQLLGRRLKSGIYRKIKSSIKGLSVRKKKGGKIGRLRFKSQMNCIHLEAYPHAFYIDHNRMKIELKKGSHLWFEILGTEQIPPDANIVCGDLIRIGQDFYVNVCFESKMSLAESFKIVGVDLGLKNQMVLSNGIEISYDTLCEKLDWYEKRIKRAQKKISRKTKGSRNYYKNKDRIAKLHALTVFLKNDNRGRIVHAFMKAGVLPVFQNDSLKDWQLKWGKKIGKTSLSKIRDSFIRIAKETGIEYEINRFTATTQICSKCGAQKKMELDERTYKCEKCGLEISRDLNSAINIEKEFYKHIPVKSGEFTPVESSTSALLFGLLRDVPNITVSTCSIETGTPRRVSSLNSTDSDSS